MYGMGALALPVLSYCLIFAGKVYLLYCWIYQRKNRYAWGVIYLHQDFFKKCQVLATRMLATPAKTMYSETLGTHGKYLDDLGCDSKYIDMQQAVVHLIVAAIAVSAPALVRPATKAPDVFTIMIDGDGPDSDDDKDEVIDFPVLDGPRPINVNQYLVPAGRIAPLALTPAPPPAAGGILPPAPEEPAPKFPTLPTPPPPEAHAPLATETTGLLDDVSDDGSQAGPEDRVEGTRRNGYLAIAAATDPDDHPEQLSQCVDEVTDAPEELPRTDVDFVDPELHLPKEACQPYLETSFLPDGTGIMGYMCPDQSLEGVAKDVKFGELTEKLPAGKTAQIHAKEDLIERLHIIRETEGVIYTSQLMEAEGITPQARVCGPVLPDDLPKIAGSHSTCEKRAVAMRHFKEDDIAGKVQPHVMKDVREHTKMFIEFVRTGMAVPPEAFEMHGKRHAKTSAANAADMTYLDWGEMMSKSWTKEDGWKVLEKVFTECCWAEGGTRIDRQKAELRKMRSLKRNFFVKLNEALEKVKPRLIQQAGKEGSATHIADAGVLEKIVFGIAFLEMRSIKHATPRQLRKRFATLLDRFFSGYAMSGDFGKYDSCMKATIREEVENTIVWELLSGLNKGSPVTDRALGDRLKKQLSSMSSHHWLSTFNAGRESGDRGTSLLNYITNLIIYTITVAREVQHREVTNGASSHDARLRGITQVKRWYQGESTGFDWAGEGDDNLQLYARAFVAGAPGKDLNEKRLGMSKRIVETSTALGFYLEPQGVDGEAPLQDALVPVTKRVEFTSKIMVPFKPAKGQLFVSFLPKVKKTIIGSQVTFCTTQTHATAGFMKYLGMMHSCIDVPPLFEYAAMFARHYERVGGGFSLEALTSYDSQRLTESYGEDYATWLLKLREAHKLALDVDGQTTAMQRAIQGEAPRLTGSLQEVAVSVLREQNGTFDECCLVAKEALLRHIF
jgi:hypothetical protein